MTSIKSLVIYGLTFTQIDKAVRVWVRQLIIKAIILGLMVGCVIGYIIRHKQVDPYIRELEKDRALFTQLRWEKARAEMVAKAIEYNAAKGKRK